MNSSPRILLVDDDRPFLNSLLPFLQRAGLEVETAVNGKDALDKIARWRPHLVALDIEMPQMNGREVVRQLRREGNPIPIIMITHLDALTEQLAAFDEGADDYIRKTFDPQELVARIHAVLRRAQSGQPSLATARCLRCQELRLDRQSRRVYLGKKELRLPQRTFLLLDYLMVHPDELISRQRLLEAVWGWGDETDTRVVDLRVSDLRQALGEDRAQPRFIETVHRQGYRFIGTVKVER